MLEFQGWWERHEDPAMKQIHPGEPDRARSSNTKDTGVGKLFAGGVGPVRDGPSHIGVMSLFEFSETFTRPIRLDL